MIVRIFDTLTKSTGSKRTKINLREKQKPVFFQIFLLIVPNTFRDFKI